VTRRIEIPLVLQLKLITGRFDVKYRVICSTRSDSTEKETTRQAMKNRRKLSSQAGPRTIRIAVLGQDGVGKTGINRLMALCK